MKTTTRFLLLLLLISSRSVNAQYCITINQGQDLEPIINGVSLGDISNLNSGFPLLEIGYSDYTTMSTDLVAGSSYTLTINSGAYFQYNYAAWIDFNHNFEFEPNEKIGSTITAFNYPEVLIDFTVPSWAHNGVTRLRTRATAEPYGVWLHPTDPCAPWQWGETEDYSVNISGGLVNDISPVKISNPVSGVTLANESLTVSIQNRGTTDASGFVVNYSVNGGTPVSENFAGSISPGSSVPFTFATAYDFSDISCYDVKAWVEWTDDESLNDDTIVSTICHTEPVNGSTVWYLQSNINGGLEPLGGEPYNSTTNRTCMNDVFGENGWLEGSFEETDMDSVFSTSTCLIFIDGSYEGEVRLQSFVQANGMKMENWVASGGHLFLLNANDGSLDGDSLIFNLGFNDTKVIASFVIGYGIPYDTLHPIFAGPYTPAAKQWGAFYYAPSVMFGNDLDTLIADNDDAHFLWQTLNIPLLAEKKWGNGKVIFGTISPSQLVTPSSSAMNNRRNTLVYLHDCIATGDANAVDNDNALAVFPNPASGEVTIRFTPSSGAISFSVSDINGRKVKVGEIEKLSSGEMKMDVSGFADGIYLLEVNDDAGKMVKKLVVAH